MKPGKRYDVTLLDGTVIQLCVRHFVGVPYQKASGSSATGPCRECLKGTPFPVPAGRKK